VTKGQGGIAADGRHGCHQEAVLDQGDQGENLMPPSLILIPDIPEIPDIPDVGVLLVPSVVA
jgi:hypothetical protein